MPSAEPDKLFERGLAALDGDDTLSALVFFEKACQLDNKPLYTSYFALCLAKERGQYKKAIALCREAIENDEGNQVHYLNLGRIHVLMGSKQEAIQTFRDGLAYGRHPDIAMQLERLGARKKPVLPFLKRSNPINKLLGVILGKLGLR